MTDFSKTLFHASALWMVMNDGRGKTPLEKYEDAKAQIEEENEKLIKIKNQESIPYKNKVAKIELLTTQLAELELHKDDDILPESTKTFLTRIYAWEKYKKWNMPSGEDFGNASSKGRLVEPDSIRMVNELDDEFYEKNEIKLKNEFICGTPDIVVYSNNGIEKFVEIKSSFNIDTFIANLDKSELLPMYYWQMQAYMMLTDTKEGEINFCLITNPPELLAKQMPYILFITEGKYTEDAIRNNLNYDSIPMNERRIKFTVKRDDAAIAKISKRILKCREYLSEIEENHLKSN